MKHFLIALLFFATTSNTYGQGYVFFLHNMYLEIAGIDGAHPEYGKVEYREIISAFQQAHLYTISEIRPVNTDAEAYAAKVAKQIDSLLQKGIKPSHITVVGTSKGGYIAQKVSGLVKNDQVNFVFIGSCNGENGLPGVSYYGNILSIYERSDVIGRSCKGIPKTNGSSVTRFKEIELNTGRKHGFLFKADPKWVQPAISWAKQEYK
jgi:hypothetical protein